MTAGEPLRAVKDNLTEPQRDCKTMELIELSNQIEEMSAVIDAVWWFALGAFFFAFFK